MEVVDKAGGLRDQYGHFCNEQGYILNEDGRYSFTKNYNAGWHQKPPQVFFYQSPPPPPAANPNDELEAMMQLMLANEQKISSDISTISGRLEVVTTHLKMLDTQVTQNAEALRDYHAMSIMEVDSVYMAEEEECVKLTEESNAVLHNRTVKELEDPVRFELPVQIDSTVFPHSLCDSGSAINTKPKVSHPRLPKYFLDPISPKQLLGFQKMVRRIPHALTFEEAIEYRPLLSHFRGCRESIEEIEILFLEARHPPLKITTSHVKAKEKVTKHQAQESDFSEDDVHKEIGSSSGTHQDAVPINVEEKSQLAPAPSAEHLILKIPEISPDLPDPDPEPPEHNETKAVEMSPKEAATPGSCHKRKFYDITLHPSLKRIRADSGVAVTPTAAYVIDPGDTYGVYSRGPRPPPEQWYVLFELPPSPTGTQSYPTSGHPDVAYLPDPEKPGPVYHMGPRPP